jgi:CubicO group peptidase (beta-lactamase class C family)
MRTLLALILSILLIACERGKENGNVVSDPAFNSIQDTIIKDIQKNTIPSFSVAVSVKGSIVWQQSYGWADKEKKIKADPSTSYALASLSKSITSTALMILVEKGLVNLDDPVGKYLGDAKMTFYMGKSSQLKVRDLTNMMGGIPHQYEYYYNDENKTKLPIEEQIKRYGIVTFPPGLVFNYSNFSPAIVEQIIRQVTKKELPEFIQEMVFTPLGMNHSSVNRNEKVAKGYDNKGNPLEESEFYPKGGAGYYASVSDLINFGRFHLKENVKDIKSVISEKNLDILHSSNEIPGYNKFYSNGWGVLNLDSEKNSLLSNGAIDGAASSLLLLTDSDIAIACLTNASAGNDFTDQMAFRIADILVPGYLRELEKFFEKNSSDFSDIPFVADDRFIGTWEGKIKTYADSIPVKMVFDKNGKIYITLENQFETLLNNVTISNGLIHGQCFGTITLPETEGYPHYLEFTVKEDSGVIYGNVSAQSYNLKRPYFLIPAFIRIKKVI